MHLFRENITANARQHCPVADHEVVPLSSLNAQEKTDVSSRSKNTRRSHRFWAIKTINTKAPMRPFAALRAAGEA